ncbi:hypothetical protein B0H15DRAFT_1022994 [Mycena belliarum]|uniref:F-box domain-containing protein n=1 Tax=Mycena belliarum TaxID=1033014 RepID=A0AAD6XN68_9AGAR|nr:hypothetical protein B0H15DRAFT_1022994 [Mycena belliae]
MDLLLPDTISYFFRSNDAPSAHHSQLIREHVLLLQASGGYAEEVRDLTRILSGVRQLPNELLSKIFQHVVDSDRCYSPGFGARLRMGVSRGLAIQFVLSQVSRHWEAVAKTTSIWKRLWIALDEATYPRVLRDAHLFFGRNTNAGPDLQIYLRARRSRRWGGHPGQAPQASIKDIICEFSARITVLALQMKDCVIEQFLRLPPGALPALKDLTLELQHHSHMDGGWLLYGPTGAPTLTPLAELAPRLSKFEIGATRRSGSYDCPCELALAQVGFNFALLTSVVILIGVPYEMAQEFLRSCVWLEECRIRIRGGNEPDRVGPDHRFYEDEEQQMIDYEEEPRDLSLMIIHPNLRRFTVEFWDSNDPRPFFDPLVLPALEDFTYNSEGGLAYSQESLILFFRRSALAVQMKRLALHRNGGLSRVDMQEILYALPSLKALAIRGCVGTLYDGLLWTKGVFVPTLEYFECTHFRRNQEAGVIRFIDSRCPEDGESTTLRDVRLRPSYPISLQSLLNQRVCEWRSRGLRVGFNVEWKSDDGSAQVYDEEEDEDEDEDENEDEGEYEGEGEFESEGESESESEGDDKGKSKSNRDQDNDSELGPEMGLKIEIGSDFDTDSEPSVFGESDGPEERDYEGSGYEKGPEHFEEDFAPWRRRLKLGPRRRGLM